MTVADALREAAAGLSSDTARLDAELLMAHALGVSRSDLLLRHMQDAATPAFAALVERRAAHEPIAYIIGTQQFYGRDFIVTPDVLIPRGDSETTLEAMLADAPADARVLDCGTGTGALLLSFLAERTGAHGIGIDSSPGAINVAQRNAAALHLQGRAQIVQADWLASGWASALGQFDRIVANPPYVEHDAALDPDVRDYEPAAALFAGPDGLDDYRALIPQLPALLATGGIAVLEIGHTQADAVSKISAQAGFTTEMHRDLAQRPRALTLRPGEAGDLGVGKA